MFPMFKAPLQMTALLGLLALGLTACGGTHRRVQRGTGAVTGVVKIAGPMCPRQGCGSAAGLVVVFNRSGRVVDREHVRGARHFRFVLAPGRYELNAGGRLRYKYPLNCPPRSALVRPGRTTRVNVKDGCGII
jgi:hypothetical protein